jgi:signal transduction histidine kinase
MKQTAFYNTIGFKLTIWYTALLVLFGILIIASINLAMWQVRVDLPRRFIDSNQSPIEVARLAADRYVQQLRRYSLLNLGGLVIVGGVGGYLLSRQMLKPVDRVTMLAKNISTSNLKDRIAYQGPDDEMKRLADTFDEMLDRLENAFEGQNQFIQDASHELRTPVAIARTNIEVLEMEEKPTIKDYKHLVEVLKLSIERMSRLSEKLLVLSKAERESDDYSDIDAAGLLGEVVTEFSTLAENNDLSLKLLKVPKGAYIKGDTFSLKQAVSNLVDNAIRYNHPGGEITISAELSGLYLVIRVADTGVGIPEKDQQRIFERFYRVDKSRSRSRGGSGLGLAMVKKIAESHGGRISVESSSGKGSVFSLFLPAN